MKSTKEESLNVAVQLKEQGLKPNLKVGIPDGIKKLIDIGIPIRKAVFHRTVLFEYAGGTPESAYYAPEWSENVKKHKMARMWYTPHGLVCEQNSLYKIVPLANVSDTTV